MNTFDALFGAISDPLTGKILDPQYSLEQLLPGLAFFLSLPINWHSSPFRFFSLLL